MLFEMISERFELSPKIFDKMVRRKQKDIQIEGDRWYEQSFSGCTQFLKVHAEVRI